MNCNEVLKRSALNKCSNQISRVMSALENSNAHFIFHIPLSGQSSTDRSKDSARDTTVVRVLTSGVNGMTATIRGAPSTPLNMRVPAMRAFRFLTRVCFALFFLFKRDCATALEAGEAFSD